jgi:hypothetical protein
LRRHRQPSGKKKRKIQDTRFYDVDPITEMDAYMSDLTISSSSIDEPSGVTPTKTLTWNKAILSDYAEFKRVDPENEVVMLKNNIDCFKCVMDLFVIDGSKKSFSIVFTPFLPPHKKND